MYDDPLLYDLRTAGLARDERFWTRRAATFGGPILELGCGTGRVSLPLAAQGHLVLGLDLCREMLRRASTKARDRGLRPHLFRADMRRFGLEPIVRLALIPYQSLHDLPELGDWESCLEATRRALAPGGVVVVDERDPPRPIPEPRLLRSLRHPEGGVVRVLHRIEPDGARRQVAGEIRYRLELPGRTEEKVFPFRGSFATREDFLAMVGLAGLRVLETWGGYDDRPLEAEEGHRIYLLGTA